VRTYGRIWGVTGFEPDGTPILPTGVPAGQQTPVGVPIGAWQEVQTGADGSNDMVYFVTLCQCLLLELNEDPSFANYGVPVTQAVQTGVPPDIYVSAMQLAFAQYFVSLTLVRAQDANGNPVYNISALFHNGVQIDASVPVPF